MCQAFPLLVPLSGPSPKSFCLCSVPLSVGGHLPYISCTPPTYFIPPFAFLALITINILNILYILLVHHNYYLPLTEMSVPPGQEFWSVLLSLVLLEYSSCSINMLVEWVSVSQHHSEGLHIMLKGCSPKKKKRKTRKNHDLMYICQRLYLTNEGTRKMSPSVWRIQRTTYF